MQHYLLSHDPCGRFADVAVEYDVFNYGQQRSDADAAGGRFTFPVTVSGRRDYDLGFRHGAFSEPGAGGLRRNP
jgi:hypothetical protein